MEKKILKRLSNYLIYELEKDDFGYLCISTVMGDWQLSYREDSPMNLSLRMMMDSDSAMENFCTLMFVTTYTLHSPDMYRKILGAIDDEIASAGVPDVTREKDEEMLNDTIEMEELKDKLEEYGES